MTPLGITREHMKVQCVQMSHSISTMCTTIVYSANWFTKWIVYLGYWNKNHDWNSFPQCSMPNLALQLLFNVWEVHMAQGAIICSMLNQFFWNFHNWKVIERSTRWRHKIMALSHLRLDLSPLQQWYVTKINACSDGCNLSYSLMAWSMYVQSKRIFFRTVNTSQCFSDLHTFTCNVFPGFII